MRVYDKNPYLPHESENALRVLIKDIPLSVHESIILDELEAKNCKINGHVIYPKLRVDGKLTQCLTGDRVLYIDPPTQPLPRFMRFHSFRARVFHHGQPTTEANVTCSQCLQAGHHRSKCNNEMVCRLCKNVGHMQNVCPTVSVTDKQQRSSKPKTPAYENMQPADATDDKAVTQTTNAADESRAHPTTTNERASNMTSSARQTRSKTANKGETREKKSRGPKQQAKESTELSQILSEFRSRSSSEPNLRDAQTRITRFLRKSATSESDENKEYDETEDPAEDELSEATPEFPELSFNHDKQTSKKRRRKNTKSPSK